MVLSPDGRLAYVVCVETDNIFVIDVATSQIVQAASLWPAAAWELGPGVNAIAIAPDGRKLVVAATNDESILVVDAASLAVTRRVPVEGQPCGVAVSLDGTKAYIATSSPGTFVTFVDLTSGSIAKRISATDGIGEAYALALSPDGKEIFVAAATALAIVNASTGRVVGSVAYPAGWIQKIAVAPDGGRVYISDLTNGKVHAIDVAQRRLASSFDVQLAEGLAVSDDRNRLYVTTFGFQGTASYNVAMLDAQSGAVLASAAYEHPAGGGVSDINTPTLSSDGRTLFLPSVDADGVLIVDADTLAARGMILLNALAEFRPWRSVLSPDGRFLYVASKLRVPTTVDVIDTQTCEVVGVIVAGPTSGHRKSSGLDVSPDGKRLWVLSGDDRCLLAADATARTFVDSVTIPEAEYLTQVVVDPAGALAYVLDIAGSVYVVDLPGRRVVATIPTGVEQAMTMKLWPDRHRLYLAGSLSYAVVDTMSRRVAHTSAFGAAGEFVTTTRGIAFLPGQSAYVISDHFGVHLYDAATDKEMRYLKLIQLAGPIHPLTADIIVSPDEQRAYFALWDEEAVLVVNPTTWQVVAAVDTGRMPFSGATPRWLSLDAAQDQLYVVCEEGDRVVVIDTTTLGVTGVVRLDE
jgi:YVTN family beta-propeller protein